MTNEQRDNGQSQERTRVGGWRSLVALAAVLMMIAAFSTPVSAQVAPPEDMTLSGNSKPSTCNRGKGAGAIRLTGDLKGCLTFFPQDYTCDELNGFDRYQETGREVFVGSLLGERGRFRTNYTLEATYAPGFCRAVEAGEFPFELQLTGGCDHHVKGKTGAFEGVKGLIRFFDVIPDPGESGASNFLYAANLEM